MGAVILARQRIGASELFGPGWNVNFWHIGTHLVSSRLGEQQRSDSVPLSCGHLVLDHNRSAVMAGMRRFRNLLEGERKW